MVEHDVLVGHDQHQISGHDTIQHTDIKTKGRNRGITHEQLEKISPIGASIFTTTLCVIAISGPVKPITIGAALPVAELISLRMDARMRHRSEAAVHYH